MPALPASTYPLTTRLILLYCTVDQQREREKGDVTEERKLGAVAIVIIDKGKFVVFYKISA